MRPRHPVSAAVTLTVLALLATACGETYKAAPDGTAVPQLVGLRLNMAKSTAGEAGFPDVAPVSVDDRRQSLEHTNDSGPSAPSSPRPARSPRAPQSKWQTPEADM
ncbi:hypothetical protein [Streptomyces broussonetiae]|uniref:Lipoprotein n=1 Tax=Streptomyces broussonetiae TaxID=2686304 RepID=A0A6I6N2H4_9ACTN|nr:hypothetical protein [Streptomyces broussonetiae]QHA06873.1 hypothetical protein GQF42_29460 [Streptomyces broussonetiae]